MTTSFAVCLIAWTVLPLLRHEAWWIRLFDFPRMQLLLAIGLAIAAYFYFVGWVNWVDTCILAALFACFIYQAICIAPYTSAWTLQLRSASQEIQQDKLSVLSVNVLTPNRNAQGLKEMVRRADPDVLLTIETDSWWERQLNELESAYPHSVKHPLDNLYGMHLYSRLPLIQPSVKFLVEDDKPSIHTQVELPSGVKVMLHCLHPAPPSPTENETSQERDAELILVAKSVERQTLPTVVIGDLNDVAWSATTRLFQKISGLLDPRVGRGMFNTFHAKYPFLRWPLDHIFCSSDFELAALRRLEAFGSDHFPIHAILQYAPLAKRENERLSANPNDMAMANQKLKNME